MRTNLQLTHSEFSTYLEPYQEKYGGLIEYVVNRKLVNFAVVHQPDLPKPVTATLNLYQFRLELKRAGYPPARALMFKRGKVNFDFSRKSRRRLMNAFHSWQVPEDWKRFHIILTYPAQYSDDWHVWKDHLKAFKRKLTAIFGKNIQGYWRLELQKRGAPHYHLFCAIPKGFVTNKKLKKIITKAWATIAHIEDQYQGRYATKVKSIMNDALAALYISKYCAKVADNSDAINPQFVPSNDTQFRPSQDELDALKTDDRTMGRHWGRIGKPNEQPIAVFTLPEMQQDIIKAIVVGWLQNVESTYAPRLQNKPSGRSWSVLGIKAYAMLYLWDRINPPRSKKPHKNPLI